MKKRTKAYLALLTTLFYMGGSILAVQEAQARNVYTMNWNTVVDAGNRQITSECLASPGEPNLVMLTGNMSVQAESHTITFPIHTTSAVSGSLLWNTEDADLLDVSLAVNGVALVGVNTALISGENQVAITLTPTAKAREEIEKLQPAAIDITWMDGVNPNLTGTFQIMLENTPVEAPATVETEPVETEPVETEPEETTDSTEESVLLEDLPEETQPEETETQETVPALQSMEKGASVIRGTVSTEPTAEQTQPAEEPEAMAQTEETEPQETTIPTQATEPAVTTTPTEAVEETTLPAAEPEETTAPTGVPVTDPETQPPEETTAPTDSADVGEETQPEESQPEAEPDEEQTGFRISSITGFRQQETKIPVLITLEDGIDTVKLGLTPSSDGQIQPLPKNTRFSINDGESYYMMYQEKGFVAEFSIPEGIPELPILLDFSQVGITLGSVTLTAQGFSGEASRQSGSVTLNPQGETEVLVEQLTLMSDSQASDKAWDTLFLTPQTQLQFTLPADWNQADLSYSIEILAVNDYGRVEYTPVSVEDGSLIIGHTVNEDRETVTVQMGETSPTAGTYRANFQWHYEGIPFAQEEVTFFINYSAYAQQAQSGQEVQDNE